MTLAILYSLIPFGVSWLATWIFRIRKPSGLATNIIQGIAAGFILAVVSIELIPKMLQAHESSIYFGFLIGVVLMLVIARFGGGCSVNKPLVPFLTGFGVEFFITGVLIGISTLASHSMLFIVAVALSLCSFGCSLSVSTRLAKSNFSSPIKLSIFLLITLCFPLGAIAGALSTIYVTKTQVDSVIAFGVAVLLYLSTRELLPEAYTSKSSLIPIAFFAAFLTVVLLKTL